MKLRSTISMLVSIAITLGNSVGVHASSEQPDVNKVIFPPIECDYGMDLISIDIDSFLSHFVHNYETESQVSEVSQINTRTNHSKYGSGYEAQRVRMLLDNFDYTKSHAFQILQPALCHRASLRTSREIVFRAISLAKQDGIEIRMPYREAKRNLPLLIKYVEEHFEVLHRYILRVLYDRPDDRPDDRPMLIVPQINIPQQKA